MEMEADIITDQRVFMNGNKELKIMLCMYKNYMKLTLKTRLYLILCCFGIIIPLVIFGAIFYSLWEDGEFFTFTYSVVFLMLVTYHMYVMGNQGLFYGYFQSWEWKVFWKDNDLRRAAGEHRSIIKSAVINFVLVSVLLAGIMYGLYHYKLLHFKPFDDVIIWFSSKRLVEYIRYAWLLPVYFYFLMGFALLFFGFMIYFFVYRYYPPYTLHTVPLNKDILNRFRKLSIRDTLLISVVCGLAICYILFNIPSIVASYDPAMSSKHQMIMTVPALFFGSILAIYQARIKWLNVFILMYIGGFVFLLLNKEEYAEVVTGILKVLIPVSLVGMLLLVLVSMGVVVMSWLRQNKEAESQEYDEINEKMKPWLGFNGRFVSESFINGDIKTIQELYEETHPKKKCFFWPEYFFANILNKNVDTLHQGRKGLWMKSLFNNANDTKHKSLDPSVPLVRWGIEELDQNIGKKVKETQRTISKSRWEDPEGDMFLNLELEGRNIENQTPSLWLPFYVSGMIYCTVVPYFLVYNAFMWVVFTKFMDRLVMFRIEWLNIMIYGLLGAQGLIFLGFLLSIFANNVGVWLAWKKYYRLKEEGNNEALFFSIFKQRVLYQNMYEYVQNEQGEIVTNNYEAGLYPQINIEIVDRIAEELSPKYYAVYSKKFPLQKLQEKN